MNTIPLVTPAPEDARGAILREAFEQAFKRQRDLPCFLITVPLRLAPLGAHSDHQGGTVTGFAIDRFIHLFGQTQAEPTAKVQSLNFGQQVEVSFKGVAARVPGEWGNYLRGAVQALHGVSSTLDRGLCGVVHGDMPIGGLSSSAAVTIAYLLGLQHVNRRSITPPEMIALVRAVENDYLGLHNGILDQAVIMSSQRDALTVIDCATHHIRSIKHEVQPEPYEIMVVYSGLSRQLTGTPFNQRVAECAEAARELRVLLKLAPVERPLLHSISPSEYATNAHKLSPTSRKRAQHFFGEAARVQEGIQLWRTGDMSRFGELVTASGNSSIVNYESGSPALISLYEILADTSGVYGTRFCGGGFQGCCLALIHPEKRDLIAESLHSRFVARHPELKDQYSIHLCRTAESVSIQELE
jgi:galactokinase/galacturonokinase